GVAAAFVSDWFVSALKPATESLGMSEAFAGLVVVAIAGNAVETVAGVQLAARNRPDFAISVVINSSLQVALFLTPVLVFGSLFFATTLTLVFPTLLAISLLVAAAITSLVVYDGESTWEEGAILIGLYRVIAASFWGGASALGPGSARIHAGWPFSSATTTKSSGSHRIPITTRSGARSRPRHDSGIRRWPTRPTPKRGSASSRRPTRCCRSASRVSSMT